MRLHRDLNIMVERDEEAQKTLYRKLAKLASKHLGDVGLADAEKPGGFHLFQAALLYDVVDLEYKLRFDEVLLGVCCADTFEYVVFRYVSAHSDFTIPRRQWEQDKIAVAVAEKNLDLFELQRA